MTEPQTLPEAFRATVARRGELPALEVHGRPVVTWREYGDRVASLATGLLRMGLPRGGTVGLITRNSVEFHLVDLAIMEAGGVPFSLQEVEPADRVAALLDIAGATLLVADEHGAELARAAVALRPSTRLIMCGAARPGELTLDAVAAADADHDRLDRVRASLTPSDTATLIFTSGSTGAPKAVQLPHRAILSSLAGFAPLAPFGDHDLFLSYLPLSHIAERFMTYYALLRFGGTLTGVLGGPADVEAELVRVRPTRFFGVPRVFEKIADRVAALVAADPALRAALPAATDYVAGLGDRLPPADDRRFAELVAPFAPVRAALGLDRAHYLGVATAPSSREVLQRLASVGLVVGDVWGLSEAIMCTTNPRAELRLGTVGRLLDGVEGRVADDGELLVRGPNAFTGYLGDPERTAEIRDPDGWLHTGDLGALEQGYVTILGRKKEVMITAGGVNLMPSVIETAIKDGSPLIDHVFAVADGRRYVTALIALDPAELASLAARHGHRGDLAQLVELPVVREAVAAAVAAGNAALSRPETVRRWTIVPAAWQPGSTELTTTMKLRRGEIAAKYADLIEGMYL